MEPIEVKASGGYCELVFDNELGAGLETGEFAEGVK